MLAKFTVKAFNQEGVLIALRNCEDEVFADGMAAGLHVQFQCDVWVNQVQIFSHKQPLKRLVSSVL